MGETTGVERVYRRRRRLPGQYFVAAAVTIGVALLQVYTGDSGLRRWGSLAFGLMLVTVLVMVPLNQYRAHTRVTAHGITAQWALRGRTWSWQEVYDIRVERAPGRNAGTTYPEWITYLYDFEGRRFTLPQLNSWQLDDPYAEVADLCAAATPYRGLTWERRPDLEERIVRRIARGKTWTVVVALALTALIIAVVLAVSPV
ncbi:PH domain-containing protein [Streptomyces sp. NPDC058464]|uniref:PH domain-containing protein n=1 Tax=Streptomyces sp. NPDC058464 TaxID=3346511 RepID=UPI00365EA918